MTDLASRIAVVVNGHAKSVTPQVIATLAQQIPADCLFVSQHIEEAQTIAESIIRQGFPLVMTGGGDGTFTVMVTELAAAAERQQRPLPRMGILKLGTGNALSWVVGSTPVQKNQFRAELEQLSHHPCRPLRMVDIEGYLTPFAGVGADAQVLTDYTATKNWLKKTPLKPVAAGLFGYAVSAVTRTLPGYLFKSIPRIRVINTGAPASSVHAPDTLLPTGAVLFEGQATLCALSTIPFYGFGLRMFPFAEQRADRMHLRIATIGSLQFVTHLKPIWEGSYDNPRDLKDFLVESVRIESEPEADLQIGGDPQGKRSQFEARISAQTFHLLDRKTPRPSASTQPSSAPCA